MSKLNRIALAAALCLAAASPSAAAPTATLTPGGHTLAGPGTTTLAANGATSVYTDASGNSDACTTVVNTGRAPVRLQLTGNGSSSIDVAAGGSGALCRSQVTQVELTCLAVGTGTCAAQWRVDRD